MTSEAWAFAVAFGMMFLITVLQGALLTYVVRLLREAVILASSRTTTEAANYRRVQKTPKRRDDDDLTERELLDPTTRGV